MGFGISKSKVERNPDRKSGLTVKSSKNRNLSNKNSIASVEHGLEGKSITVLPKFTEGQQSVDTSKSVSDRQPNKTPIDFEHRGSTTAWESAEESAGGTPDASSCTGDVETMIQVSRSPKYHSMPLNTSAAHWKEQLEIQELSEEENEELKTGKKVLPFKEHHRPMRCGTSDETGVFPSTEREIMNRTDEPAFGGVTGGDKGRKSVEDLIASVAAGLANFTIPPRMSRLVTVGVARTGCLGLGELSQASGLRDMGFFADNELRVRLQEHYKPLTGCTGKPLENYRKSSFENRFDVLPKDECLDIQRAYAEIFMDGKGKRSGNQDAVERKDTADQWLNSSAHFCTDPESSGVQTDCRGDFIIALSREMETIGRDLCASSPEAEGTLDCDQPDAETAGFAVKFSGANAASDALPSKRGVVPVDVPAGEYAEDHKFSLANFPDFYGNSTRKRESTQNRSATNSLTLDQSPVFRDDTTSASGEAKVQAETGAKRTAGNGERESGDGKCPQSRQAIQSRKELVSPITFSKEWDDYDFNTDVSEPTVVGPRTGRDEYNPFNQDDDHATRYSKSNGRDSSEDRCRSANDFYGQKVSPRGHSLP